MPSAHEPLTIGELAARAGVSVATVRFYEEQGLVQSTRTAGNQRRFARHMLRRIAVVRAGQKFGLTLAQIRAALDCLPPDRAPTKREWGRMARRWRSLLEDRIAALTRLRDGVTDCIGCGCLSLGSCPLYNADDVHGADGPGAQRWPPVLRE